MRMHHAHISSERVVPRMSMRGQRPTAGAGWVGAGVYRKLVLPVLPRLILHYKYLTTGRQMEGYVRSCHNPQALGAGISSAEVTKASR